MELEKELRALLRFNLKRKRSSSLRSSSRSRPRIESSSSSSSFKDLCACVRLSFMGSEPSDRKPSGSVKWLRLKIPGSFIEKLENKSPTPSLPPSYVDNPWDDLSPVHSPASIHSSCASSPTPDPEPSPSPQHIFSCSDDEDGGWFPSLFKDKVKDEEEDAISQEGENDEDVVMDMDVLHSSTQKDEEDNLLQDSTQKVEESHADKVGVLDSSTQKDEESKESDTDKDGSSTQKDEESKESDTDKDGVLDSSTQKDEESKESDTDKDGVLDSSTRKDEESKESDLPCSTQTDKGTGADDFVEKIICQVDDTLNGPFEFPFLVESKADYPCNSLCVPIGSIMYALGGDYVHMDGFCDRVIDPENYGLPATTTNDTCHRFHSCDFSQSVPKWEISPVLLNSPRLWPKLVSIGGKIYVFGGNNDSVDAPYAEVYDPKLGCWKVLPSPPFERLSGNHLFVLPLVNSGKILLLGHTLELDICYTLDISTHEWHPPPRACTNLVDLMFGQIKKGVEPVIFGRTIYWLTYGRKLSVYNLEGEEGKYYEGLITGLDKSINRILKYNVTSRLALLPLSKHLLGLLWFDLRSSKKGASSTFHMSILHITLHQLIPLNVLSISDSGSGLSFDMNAQPSLTAAAVACLCFPFEGIAQVVDAYIIDGDEGSWQSISSCSSYVEMTSRACSLSI